MPRLLESDAEFLTLNYDALSPENQAKAQEWFSNYRQQQADDGEPLFPTQEKTRSEQKARLLSMFESPDKIDYDPGPMSLNPQLAKMQYANMALLSQRYQKEPSEVSQRYDFLLNDYARQKLGASEDVDTAKFYALAQKDMQKVKLREDTQREGMSAALRGEDGVKALAAWQAKNADRAKDDAGLFMRGFQQALEQDGEMLPIADRLLKALESGTDKTGQNVQANMDRSQVRQELGQMVEQLAGMKKAQRKSVYRSIAARIQAAGYDQKGFWSQMLGFLDQQLYAADSSLTETGGIAVDASIALAQASGRSVDMLDGTPIATPVLSAEQQQALLRQRDYRERIGDVEGEIMQIISGELDPVKPTTGWMNETIETGLIKAPGAILPSMGASALLGPYGAGLLFTADFAANNRRELVQSGLDADQARKVAVMAAPLQAAVESLSNMVSLGKFPAVQAALSRFTRPVGGASLVGRYVQNSLISGATEFTEEQVQDNVVVPVMQELLGALEKDVPEVDWSFYKTRAANSTPELAATLLPMALVFGGVMTAADAKLSRTMTQNVELMMSTGMDQAQAVDVASQPTQEQRIRRGAELWNQRKGTKASMEEAQKKLADQYRTLAADSAAAVKELEARGVLPRLLPMQGGEYRLTFNDGSTADFKTREEALGGIHVYIRDRMQRSTRALRETIDTLTKNLEQGREFALEISPEAMPADEAVKRGIISPQALQERAEQGAILDATTLIENSVLTGKALGDEEAPLMLFGMSKNEWYDKEGRAIGMQRIKDDILRTTMRLWDGASPLTLIEEKTEGDAKVILSTPGKRQWMLDHLRAYEDASGDKLFTSDDNEQINDKQLIEAWSHMAQSYFVAAKDKVKGRTLGRYLRDIEEAELTAAMQGRASWWQAVVNRAQKLGELKAAGKLNEDVVAELEKQLGIDSQVKHEQEAMQEAQQVANEVAQQVDTSGYSEANPGPNGETFSASRAIPADASKVVQMPDGARLVGPTTFSIRAFHGTPHKVDKFRLDKIGTGEGAQAYGWGLYFAESRDVGEGYRDKLAQWTLLTSDGKIYDDRKELKNLNVRAVLNKNGSIDEAVARARSVIESIPGTQGAELALADIATLEKLKQSGGLTKTKGNLYTVELLPDADEFLDWDKPLSEQSEKVRKAVGPLIHSRDTVKEREVAFAEYDAGTISKLELSKRLEEIPTRSIQQSDTGAAIYQRLWSSQTTNGREASEFLASIGIPGIRYLDGQSRDGGSGTSNFVIFDESLVKILEENGKPVAQETFSLRVTPAQDAEYMAAVEAGDMETAQKMVDEAALASGLVELFHGSSANEDVKIFEDRTTSSGALAMGIYMSPDIETAQNYGKTGRYWVDINLPGFAEYNKGLTLEQISRGETTPVEGKSENGAWKIENGMVEVVVRKAAQIKSADPVTRDESGNVIPLSQRFNPADDRITYSLRPGDFASRVEAMFSPFQRSPEARLIMARVAKDRALRVMPQLLELQAQFNDINRQRQDLETKFAEESAQLLADLEADEQQVRQERDFELKGVSQDKGSELDRERIRRDADNKLSRLRLEYERSIRELEKRKETETAKLARKDNSAQREKTRQLLKLHDAILAAVPAKIRPSIGGFASVVKFTSNEQALEFLQKRMTRIDSVVEKYLITEARGQLERIFDKARPKSGAGEKAKGKLTPELHAWFKLAEEATKLSPAVADERIQGIEQSLASDMTDAIKQELSDWLGRPVTDDAEAQTWQETRLTLFQTFGAVMYGTDAKSERNAAEITAALDAAREAYQTGRLAHIEQLAKLREKRAEERGDGIQRVGSPYDPNKANTRKKALNEATGLKGRALDYMDTGLDASGFCLDLLGDDTATDLYETTRRNLLEAAATKADNMEKRKADFAAMLKQVFPGKGLVDRLRGLWELQQIQENAPVGTMSQLQAMQFTLWHLDPDSREWLATNGYGDEWQAKAEQWLTAEAKAVRAWLLKQYDGQYDRLNPVFRRLRGVNLPRVEVYGGKRQIEHSKSDSTASIESDMMRGGMDAGFTKTRVSRPTGRPRMTDALQNYWQNALQVEHYIAFAETVTELKAVFGHRDFLGAVETNRGLAKKQQVLDWISNIETAGTRDAFAHSMQGKLFGRYGKAVSASALLLKLVTLAKQAPAAIQSAFKVGLKEYFTSLSRILAGKGAISLGDMYRSDTVQRRLSEHDNEMLQASKGWNQRHFENEILDKAAIAPEVMMNAGWYAMGWTDARFTTISAAVAYDVAFRDGKKLGMTDDEAKAFAANQADLIVMETAQPQDVVTKSLSENMMPQALLRLVFAFQSANRQVFGLTYLAAKQGKVANAYAVAALIAGLTQTIGGVMRMMFSDDDPEELFDPQAYALGMATAPVTGMVGFGPLVELVLNFAGVESRFSPSSAAAAKSLQDIVNGEADTKDVGRVVSMAGAALGGRGAMLGVGWNVLNQIMGLYENVTANE